MLPPEDKFTATWDAGVIVSWNINDMLQAKGSSRELRAKADQVEAQKNQLKEGLQIEVMDAVRQVKEADAAIRTVARGLIAAEEFYRVRLSLYQNGRATIVDLNDAETELTRARLDMVNTRVDQRISRLKLRHALGRDVGVQP